MKFMKISLLSVLATLVAFDATAFEYENGNSKFKLTAMGTIGAINPEFEDPVFINDWRVRAE